MAVSVSSGYNCDASIYWPDVSASSVLQLASQLYPEETLTATDANTVQCQVVSPVTYIPIPPGSGGSFAGLMTVELPASVRAGKQIVRGVVRRITTRQVTIPAPPPPPPPPQRAAAGAIPQVAIPGQYLWREFTGSFLVKIPVQKESTILPGDENLLAILKWRLTSSAPATVGSGAAALDQYLSDRINGMGGNASRYSTFSYRLSAAVERSPVTRSPARLHRQGQRSCL